MNTKTNISRRLDAVERALRTADASETIRRAAEKFGLDLSRPEIKTFLESAIRSGKIDTDALTMTWETFLELRQQIQVIGE